MGTLGLGNMECSIVWTEWINIGRSTYQNLEYFKAIMNTDISVIMLYDAIVLFMYKELS